MAFDLLIKHGRVVDGSDMPSFHGDVAVKDGKIAEVGKLNGAATRTIVNGQVLIEDGQHTGAYPGRVVRNSLYAANGA